MTIRISFSDTTVRVAVEINGAIESKVVELPQRTWVGLSDGVMCDIAMDHNFMSTDWIDFARAIEAKLKENNSAA